MDSCCGPLEVKNSKFKFAVWIALALNFGMFFYEFGMSFLADSSALKADALDFLGDSANYAISLFVLGRAVQFRASAALIKGLTMGGFGIWVFGYAIWTAVRGASPDAQTMSLVGFIALMVNVTVALMLYQFRDGDSNMKSVWLCSRNDAVGNIAVMIAGGAVYFTHTMWPDLIVALLMAYLGLSASIEVIRAAIKELREPQRQSTPAATCSSKKV